MLALMMVLFTQCKKDNLDNTDSNTETDVRKVKVRCEIPLGDNKGAKSDFTDLMTDGSIKWSTGTERIYLAVHHETNPQIVELTAETTLSATTLAFEGEVDETILTDGETYNVWYLGNSMNLETPYVTKTETDDVITSISGSIATQSGSLEDLGYHHIAKAEVTATEEADGSFTLPLHGMLKNQMAIAYMDLTDVTKLSGSAIVGTGYTLAYSDGEYKFEVSDENKEISIEGENADKSKSFVVLLPNASANVDIENNNNYRYTFKDGLAASSLYYRYISDVEVWTLKWEYHPFINGHEYVDLGLPSGLKWATCNVGANASEEYGNYYAWGETTTKSDYSSSTSLTYGLSNSQLLSQGIIDGNNNLTPSYDAATANWGGSWRMPTKAEYEELIYNCTWTWTTQNDVNGYKVTGKNGNYIFLPAAGYRFGSSLYTGGDYGYYWSSTPYDDDLYDDYAYYLYFGSGGEDVNDNNRYRGHTVRPVSK